MNYSKKVLFLVLICSFLFNIKSQHCKDQSYLIPNDQLANLFTSANPPIHAQWQLQQLIGNPNSQNMQNVVLKLTPYSAPLYVMAAITFVIFVVSIVQVSMYNCCQKKSCGKQITKGTYSPCGIRILVITFIIFAIVAGCISIAALVVNSDLQKALEFTQCNTQNIIYQTYNGNSNGSWSGINNFANQINQFSSNIQNDIPFLSSYFNSSNVAYSSIIDQSQNSLYQKSQNFYCENYNNDVACPFPDPLVCQIQYKPIFSSQYCQTTTKGSVYNLINNQMIQNSTQWLQGTLQISQSLQNINTNQTQVDQLVQQVTQFTTLIGQYQQSISNGMDFGQLVVSNLQIALYVFYSFILFMSIVGIIGVSCVFCCKNFKCKFIAYILWYVLFLLAFLLFIASGLFLTSSLITLDTCQAYPYYFENKNNFQKLKFKNQQIGELFETCFFSTTQDTSIFSSFDDSQIFTQFSNLYFQYSQTIPSSQFYSVVSQVQSQLLNYKMNPNTVIINQRQSTQQPQAALDNFNTFVNWSNPNSLQNCHYTKDYFSFNYPDCNNYLVNAQVGNNRCVVIGSNNYNNTVTNTASQLSLLSNCSQSAQQGQSYLKGANALQAYSQNIAAIVNGYVSITLNSSNSLQNYQNNYFNYYNAVSNFYNQQVINTFNGFFKPYKKLDAGSSCQFVTASMNGIINQGCNQLFPYINLMTALNIVDSVFIFAMFIIAYFLTTRFEFFQLLDGDFDNYQQQNNNQSPQQFKVNQSNASQLQQNFQLQTSLTRDGQFLNNPPTL